MNMLKLRRLVEQDEPMSAMTAPAQPDMQMPAMPADLPAQLPTPAQSTVPVDPMTMTVRDFLDKCKSLDPLVCMGIESFIEKNTEAFGADQAQSEPDLTFSNAVQPAAPQAPAQVEPFSLDQAPDALNFPG
jgi:hypothetical protein